LLESLCTGASKTFFTLKQCTDKRRYLKVTVGELIELLDGFDPDAEVRIVSPNGEVSLYDIEKAGIVEDSEDSEEDEANTAEAWKPGGTVYLVQGVHLGSAPREMWGLL
jgi:hypothetical protein